MNVSPRFALCTLLALLPTACSRGGGGLAGARADESLAAYDAPLTAEDARFFLRRTTFGADPRQVEELQRVGLAAWLDAALTFQTDTPVERAAEEVFANPRVPRPDELARWWLFLMTRSEQPLQEVLAFFWHDHFAASQLVLDDKTRRYYRDYVGLMRQMAAGNLREFCYRAATDPVVLVFLDGISSTRQNPNANFGREFFEVFTLGRNNGYTEADVAEASRAFTGWRRVEDRQTGDVLFVWDESRHDDGMKTVLGKVGRFGYREVVDVTFEVGAVAEYITAKLFAYFCHETPSPALVAQMSRLLRDSGYELKPLLRTILGSRAMFAARARGPRERSPVELAVGFSRTTGLEVPFEVLYEHLLGLRHVPTQPPSVFGWPGGWIGEHPLVQRANLLNAMVVDRDHQARLGVGITRLLPPAEQRSTAQVVDHLAAMLSVPLTDAERAMYVDYLDSRASTSGGELRVERSPFDADDARHVDERLRGLLFLLAQHPVSHTR